MTTTPRALEVAQSVLELLQDDFEIPCPPKGDPDCADLIIMEAGKERFLIQITDLQAVISSDLCSCDE